jgi:hypothetical protein
MGETTRSKRHREGKINITSQNLTWWQLYGRDDKIKMT